MTLRQVIDSFGFDAYGVVPYGVLSEERERLDRWLLDGCHADREYMVSHRREDPAIVLPQCQSLIVVLFSPQRWDYHSAIRKKLKQLLSALREVDPTIEGRGVVDTAPVMERSWARRAGLGWIGRNSLLVNERLGSDFNIGILLINKSIDGIDGIGGGGGVGGDGVGCGGGLAVDHCVGCGAPCVAACPVGAIRDDRTVDCRVCLSALSQQSGAEVKGCKVCQEACLYNLGRM